MDSVVLSLDASPHANAYDCANRYLFIKEVAEATNPDDVIIVTSSLTKDMNSAEDLYRYVQLFHPFFQDAVENSILAGSCYSICPVKQAVAVSRVP